MSDRETRHLDEHGHPDDTDRYPPEWVRCELCRGTGEVPPTYLDPCPRCDGAGELLERR